MFWGISWRISSYLLFILKQHHSCTTGMPLLCMNYLGCTWFDLTFHKTDWIYDQSQLASIPKHQTKWSLPSFSLPTNLYFPSCIPRISLHNTPQHLYPQTHLNKAKSPVIPETIPPVLFGVSSTHVSSLFTIYHPFSRHMISTCFLGKLHRTCRTYNCGYRTLDTLCNS